MADACASSSPSPDVCIDIPVGQVTFGDLPDEIVETILSKVDFSRASNIIKTSLVNKLFYRYTISSGCWREVVKSVRALYGVGTRRIPTFVFC
jgi:hypothetical protein